MNSTRAYGLEVSMSFEIQHHLSLQSASRTLYIRVYQNAKDKRHVGKKKYVGAIFGGGEGANQHTRRREEHTVPSYYLLRKPQPQPRVKKFGVMPMND